MDDVRRTAPQAHIIFDTVDLHHLRLLRGADILESSPLRQEAAFCKETELRLIQEADCTLVVSTAEKSYLHSILPEARIVVVSNCMDVRVQPQWHESRNRILFVGNFYHHPNIDGMRWFVEKIFPLLQQALPSAEVDVVGDFLPATIRSLATPGIHFHGHQPCIEPFFERARICIAPLRFGAGVKGKLHMSMSEGVPFVTTTIGAEGMFLTHGIDALIADTPEDFAVAIRKLWSDRTLWNSMAIAAQKTLMAHFSPQVAEAELTKMLALLSSLHERTGHQPHHLHASSHRNA